MPHQGAAYRADAREAEQDIQLALLTGLGPSTFVLVVGHTGCVRTPIWGRCAGQKELAGGAGPEGSGWVMGEKEPQEELGLPRLRRRSNLRPGEGRHVHQVTLNDVQEARLLAIAARVGKRPAATLVELLEADAGEMPAERAQQAGELFRLHREISGAAVNMNQVAKKANTVGEVPSNFGSTMDALRAAAGTVDEAVQVFIAERRRTGRA